MLLPSFGTQAAVAFDAKRLQPLVTWPFLVVLTEAVFIEGHCVEEAVKHALGHSNRLGPHSAVYIFTLGKEQGGGGQSFVDVTKYVWSHVEYRPWGHLLPTQCKTCGCAQQWSRQALQNGTYVYRCRYELCGWDTTLGKRVQPVGEYIYLFEFDCHTPHKRSSQILVNLA